MQPLLMQLRALFREAAFPWALCGGCALELFAGRVIRPHGDIDLALPESARAGVIAYLLHRGWRIYEYRGMGRVKPVSAPQDSQAGRNLMAALPDCPLLELFPCGEEGLLYHRFVPGMTNLCFLDLLFSDGPEFPLLQREGLPILAPETALLYKADHPDDPAAQQDFCAVYPLMDDGQKARLQSALAAKYPAGHPWRQ